MIAARPILDRLLSPALRAAGPDAVRRAKLALASCAFGFFGSILGFVTSTASDLPGAGKRQIAYAAAIAWIVPILLLLKRTKSLVLIGNALALGVFVAGGVALLQAGDLGLPVLTFVALSPAIVAAVAGMRWGILWSVIAALYPITIYGLHAMGHVFPGPPPPVELRQIQLFGTLLLVLVVLGIVYSYESLKNAALRDVERANRDLAAARDAAVEAARIKSEFLATMSHEIRTPMNGVVGMTQLLLDTPLDDDQRDLVQTIRSSGDSLVTILNDVLDYSKIEAGRLQLEPQPLDVEPIVREVLDLFVASAADKKLVLTGSFEGGALRGLLGDPTRIRQVLVNLVGNAVKFTERGSIVVRTRAVRLPSGAEEVELTVRDTGIGIAPESMDCLFRSFSQVDSSTARRFGGTGLGLAISQRLAQAMGGDVTAESVLGEGSTFRFTFPIRRASAPRTTPGIATAPADDARELATRHPLRILLAEDNRVNQKVAVRLLARMGYRAALAANGLEVLSALEREVFDVILMDVQMPELDGLEATRRIRAGDWAQPRIIALTANVLSDERDACARAGMDDYVAKPVDRRALAAALLRCPSTPLPVPLSESATA